MPVHPVKPAAVSVGAQPGHQSGPARTLHVSPKWLLGAIACGVLLLTLQGLMEISFEIALDEDKTGARDIAYELHLDNRSLRRTSVIAYGMRLVVPLGNARNPRPGDVVRSWLWLHDDPRARRYYPRELDGLHSVAFLPPGSNTEVPAREEIVIGSIQKAWPDNSHDDLQLYAWAFVAEMHLRLPELLSWAVGVEPSACVMTGRSEDGMSPRFCDERYAETENCHLQRRCLHDFTDSPVIVKRPPAVQGPPPPP